MTIGNSELPNFLALSSGRSNSCCKKCVEPVAAEGVKNLINSSFGPSAPHSQRSEPKAGCKHDAQRKPWREDRANPSLQSAQWPGAAACLAGKQLPFLGAIKDTETENKLQE